MGDLLSGIWGGVSNTVSGVGGWATDLLNSKGAEGIINAGSQYMQSQMTDAFGNAARPVSAGPVAETAAKPAMPNWILPAGLIVLVLLASLLVVNRGK